MAMDFGDYEKDGEDARLKGSLVYYLDHDIPNLSARKFLKELKCRAAPLKVGLSGHQDNGEFIRIRDLGFDDGWSLYCYDGYKMSYKYNMDFRIERIVNGEIRKWFIFCNKQSLTLHVKNELDFVPSGTWGEFEERHFHKSDEEVEKRIGTLLVEIYEFIIPLFHCTKMIAASSAGEYRLMDDILRAGYSLETAVNVFANHWELPLWYCDFKNIEDL